MKFVAVVSVSACVLASLTAVSAVSPPAHAKERHGGRHATAGIASHYDHAGRRTANGETANPRGMTAAHRTLPFGTKVEVTNRRNGRTVEVRINDRGPYIRGRVIDLTTAAAKRLGFTGLAPVEITVIQ